MRHAYLLACCFLPTCLSSDPPIFWRLSSSTPDSGQGISWGRVHEREAVAGQVWIQDPYKCADQDVYPPDLDNIWGVLPGDVDNVSLAHYGYPYYIPPSCFHGAEIFVGWTQTNSFVRNFVFMYRCALIKHR